MATLHAPMATLPDAAAFSLSGGHPLLDLVNTLDNRFRADGPIELLPDYAALLRFMEQTELLDAAQARALARRVARAEAERSLDSAHELREAAASTLYATVEGSTPQPADVRKLARYLQSARQRQELVWVPSATGTKFAWDWGASQAHADLPVWILSLQASALLTSEAMSRLRTCGCETCRWLFVDTSKNHTRRWCDMKVCGNRMKARRFQARRP
jgi:predicted RNA-binding Zn ribbon-like protein